MFRWTFVVRGIVCAGLLSTMSCTFFFGDEGIQQQIVDRALKDTTNSVALKDITKFDWDTMYFVWSSPTVPNGIDSIVGSAISDDMTHQIIFIKNRKIVYKEVIFDDPDKVEKASFYFTDTLPFHCLTPQTAIFKIRSRYRQSGDLYDIIPYKKSR